MRFVGIQVIFILSVIISGSSCLIAHAANGASEALSSFGKGDYKTAEPLFVKLVEKEPNNRRAYYYLAHFIWLSEQIGWNVVA